MHQYYVGVIGGSVCNVETARLAYETGRLIAREGWVLLNGGRGGVMEEAARGATEAGGVSIGILPGDSRKEGNPYLSFALATGLGHVRNTVLVTSCDSLIAIGGEYGTLSEIAFANIKGIPVVGLASIAEKDRGLRLFAKTARTPEEAVQAVKSILGV